jgi:hypothetical protein
MRDWQWMLPIVLFVVYIINALLNKERPPAPRGLAPTSRTGGSLPPAPRPVSRDVGLRVPQPSPARPPERRSSSGDEVVVITSDTLRGNRPGQLPRLGSVTPQRRQVRPRTASSTGGTKRPEPTPDRPVRGWVSQSLSQTSVSQHIDRPLDVRPLTELQSAPNLSGQPSAVVNTEGLGPASAAEIRRSMASPSTLRDALILSELLQPPLVLRGRRPRA